MGVTINDGASQIAQLLQPEQPSEEPSNSAETEQEAPEVEAQQEVEVTEQPETEVAEVEETPEGDTESIERYTVKVGGEEQEVTLEDLRKGFMMESDYRKKTSEVARQRDDITLKQAELANKVNEAELMLKIDMEELSSAENIELKEYDPTAYYEKRERLEAKANKLKSLKEEAVGAEATKKTANIEKEKELLFQALPEWLDESALKSESEMVNKLWSDLGFTQQDLEQYTDHRLILLSREAALYRKLKNAKPESKKVTPKPKSAEPGTTKTTEQVATEKSNAVRNKARKTGNMRDAAAAIKQLMT